VEAWYRDLPVLVRLVAGMVTRSPTFRAAGAVLTKRPRPTFKVKIPARAVGGVKCAVGAASARRRVVLRPSGDGAHEVFGLPSRPDGVPTLLEDSAAIGRVDGKPGSTCRTAADLSNRFALRMKAESKHAA
jgi:hypothetical protein